MKKINIGAFVLLLLISISAFADTPPGNVQTTFKKMYPKAAGIAWSQDGGYYCANFVKNGFTKNVWFNTQGQWVMTQTDLVVSTVCHPLFTMHLYPVLTQAG